MEILLPTKTIAVDGAIDMIYGEFGGGKNVYAARIIRRALRRGIPVYSSFPITWEGIDERKQFFKVFLGAIGLKRKYKVIPKENCRRITMEELMTDEFVEKLFNLVECLVVIDEGYAARLLDSYRKTNLSVQARMAVYTTRHFDRRILIVAQRPNSIHVSSRGMVNRFYRCTQPFKFLWYIFRVRFFVVQEFQQMKNEEVDEEAPSRTRFYFATRGSKYFKMFNSKYMRGDRPNKFPSLMQVYKVSWPTRLSYIISGFSRRGALSAPATLPNRSVDRSTRVQ